MRLTKTRFFSETFVGGRVSNTCRHLVCLFVSCNRSSSMKLIVNFRLLLVVLLFGGPIMACAIPAAQLTADEKQCCKDMGGDCAPGAGMPMSHSCCKTAVLPAHDFRPSSTFSFAAPSMVVNAIEFPLALSSAEQRGQFASWPPQDPSPPREALDASAPLRI
jgi:hypothetical protein